MGRDNRIARSRYPDARLAEARRRPDAARQQVSDGIDPLAERDREKLAPQFNAANMFGVIAKERIDKVVRQGRSDTTTTKANWLLEQLKPITNVAIAELTPVHMLVALKHRLRGGRSRTT